MGDSSIKNKCQAEFDDRSLGYAISLVCTIFITIINFGLKKLLNALQDYGRYDSMSKQSSSLFNHLFVSTFINTSFLITLVYANIFDFIPMRIISFIIPNLFDSFAQYLLKIKLFYFIYI